MVLNSPCYNNEELASLKANDYCNEALAIPGQTETGKENSNLFMADSLPKTILLPLHGICINMTPFEFSLIYLVVTSMKKVIITDDSIRQALRLDDTDGVDCPLNEEIFAELARMGYEKPLVRNVDSPSKFLMYPRFLQLMINAQITDLSSHNTKYTSSALTQKVFANMRRIKKGFSGVDTSLFDGGFIQTEGKGIAKLDADEDVTLEEVDAEVTMDANVHGRLVESQAQVYHLDLKHAAKVLSMQDTDETEPAKVEEVIEVVTADKLMTEVVTTAASPITAAQVPKASTPMKRMGFELSLLGKSKRRGHRGAKTHLQIVANEDDDVYTEATPLSLKVRVVDYQIHHKHNKPYYNIIKADGTHQLFLSFITLLKNFDRENLEMLCKLVQERFQSSEPKNFSDNFLLNTFKTMFEKPNVEASIWRDQRGRYRLVKVKSWKIFESCGVHIITFTTTLMFLLVEKKYSLTRFTLKQMLNNVRLKVKEESEMSLELLRLMRRQLNRYALSLDAYCKPTRVILGL
nr:hypothetical protein [Tanacetum cinerariifolium]